MKAALNAAPANEGEENDPCPFSSAFSTGEDEEDGEGDEISFSSRASWDGVRAKVTRPTRFTVADGRVRCIFANEPGSREHGREVSAEQADMRIEDSF